jgi:hypothetical protein
VHPDDQPGRSLSHLHTLGPELPFLSLDIDLEGPDKLPK